MNKKWVIWIALGIGVAVILWIMTRGQISAFGGSGSSAKVPTPVLVPAPLPADMTTGGNPTTSGMSTANTSASTSLAEQNNIIGDHPNSTLWNGTIPDFVNYAPQQNGQAPIPTGSQTFGSTF